MDLTINVNNISSVMTMFDQIDILRYAGTGLPDSTIDTSEYTTVSGSDLINNIDGVSCILLNSKISQYYFSDSEGDYTSWYISRFTSTAVSGTSSGWKGPIQGTSEDLYYDPMYPAEVDYDSSDQIIINYIRRLIGDPVGLAREYGPDAASSVHADGRVYEFDEHGWPASINMNGVQYNELANPTVNGYKFLRFKQPIDTTITTVSGVNYSVDIWYYTFRNSDKQIMETYDNVFPPTPLDTDNCTSEIYMLQTAYDILTGESWEAITEDGARIVDEGSSYDPSGGLSARSDMLAKLQTRLTAAVQSVKLLNITGVRID